MPVSAFPTLHLNGTGADSLIRDYENALRAVRTAQQALNQSAPHSRDYYVSADRDEGRRAIAEHQRRVEKLHSVAMDLETLLEHAWTMREQRHAAQTKGVIS